MTIDLIKQLKATAISQQEARNKVDRTKGKPKQLKKQMTVEQMVKTFNGQIKNLNTLINEIRGHTNLLDSNMQESVEQHNIFVNHVLQALRSIDIRLDAFDENFIMLNTLMLELSGESITTEDAIEQPVKQEILTNKPLLADIKSDNKILPANISNKPNI